jgi:hypothetical protein
VYQKLGIHSREELAGALAGQAAAPSEQPAAPTSSKA